MKPVLILFKENGFAEMYFLKKIFCSLNVSLYSGLLASMDDFYLLGGQMVMIQTTNNIFNMSLYSLVKPESLLAWHRVRIANSMARNGKDWAQIVGFMNSGNSISNECSGSN